LDVRQLSVNLIHINIKKITVDKQADKYKKEELKPVKRAVVKCL
jgi:hypothetical protein